MKKSVVLIAVLCLLMVFQGVYANPTCPKLQYTGESQALVSVKDGEECGFFSTDGGNTYANAIPSGKNAGTNWEIWWYLSDEAKAKKLCDQTINPIDLTVTVTGSNGTLVYTGSEQSFTEYALEYEDELGEFTDSDVVFAEDFEAFTAVTVGTYASGLNAESLINTNQNYNVKFKVTDGSFEITPKDLGDSDIKFVFSPSEVSYDGREHSVSVAVYFNGVKLEQLTVEEPVEEAVEAPEELTEEASEEPAVEEPVIEEAAEPEEAAMQNAAGMA